MTTAKSAGFCFGVERAVKTALEEANKGKNVVSFGPIVHNDDVVRDLKEHGVSVVNDTSELENCAPTTVIIRAHGIPEATQNEILKLGHTIVDATCPFVKKIHKIVREASEAGENVLIIGDPLHPEVKGIRGWVKGPCFVISKEEEIESIPFAFEEPLKIVVQTTFQQKNFEKIVENIKNIWQNTHIVDTICNATQQRQEEAEQLAKRSGVMLVIGDPQSSNSQKLYNICREHCDHTYFIQTANDLRTEWLTDVQSVGITAGASTPKNIIAEVQIKCQNLNKCWTSPK